VLAVVAVQAPAGYLLPHGSVSFTAGLSRHGRLVMPLGPAGEFALRTHHTPVQVVMTYHLPEEAGAITAQGGVVDELPRLERSARAAFVRYALSRVPWLLLAGTAAGALAGIGLGRRRGALWGAVAGLTAVAVVGGGLALATLATVDRSPAVEYRGLAANVPRILPLVRALSAGESGADGLGRLQDYVDGLALVATQLDEAPPVLARERVVRLLLVSDVHDNVYAMRAAARLAAGGGDPVDAVLVAGDVTDLGTREEAQLFLRTFDPAGSPVFFVGGNHEDEPALGVFRRAGYQVLTGDATGVGGVVVLGDSDPMAASSVVASDAQRLATAAQVLGVRAAALPSPPDVLLVHDLRQAAAVVDAAGETGRDLVVAYGNDHVAGVRREGTVVLVDAGTAGASGYERIGAGDTVHSTFQLIDFSRGDDPRPLAVTTLSLARDGRTLVEYDPLR
jgi:predicted phosphodiesterase